MGTNGELLDRTPPEALDMERAVLGCFLLDGSIVGQSDLRPGDFRNEQNRLIFSAIQDIRGAGLAVDTKTLHHHLQEQGQLDAAGGNTYLAEVLQSVAVARHWVTYARAVKDAAVRRRILAAAEEAIQGAHDPRRSVAAVLNSLRGVAEDEDQHATALDFELRSCAQLDAAVFDLGYFVEHILAARQPCILGGSKKTMKTTILLALFVALATATPFLGYFSIQRAVRCALLSGESGMATIQETLRRICASMGLSLSDVGGLFVGEKLPKFGDPSYIRALERMIVSHELEVLGIDPAYLAMPGGDAANMFLMGEMLRDVAEICTATGCTMILCHHTKKTVANPFEPPELEDIAFSGFQEFCRQWILLGRREKYEAGSGDHRLWLNVGGSAGHSGLWALNIDEGQFPNRTWDVEVLKAADARQDAAERIEAAKHSAAREAKERQLEADRKRLYDALRKFPDGETARTIRDAAGMSGSRFNVALSSLIGDEWVEPCEVMKSVRKTPYEGYKPKAGADQE